MLSKQCRADFGHFMLLLLTNLGKGAIGVCLLQDDVTVDLSTI